MGNPGRDCQRVGTANILGQKPYKIDGTPWGVVGNEGDSQCYIGVSAKVETIFEALQRRVKTDDLDVRLVRPIYTNGVSDGQLNGTREMRYSLIGREVTHDDVCLYLGGSSVEGCIAVVACDKPPVGTLAAILEHNVPSIMMSDGSIRPGIDPVTRERIDIVSCFQAAGSGDQDLENRLAEHSCPGYGSCGGMFTYNTMQSFFGALGMEPLHMVSPASEDPIRTELFPDQLIDCLQKMTEKGIKPRDIVTPASLKNAMIVAMAMGGSTNAVLHGPEIANAAGIDLWKEAISQQEFNKLSRELPVVVNARPFGKYSMVDIDEMGGVQVVVKELLEAGFLDGDCITCTGETLAEQIDRLNPPAPDGDVIYTVKEPFKETGGLRLLTGNLAPEGGAVIKMAGVEGGIEDGKFIGRAKVFNSEADLIAALEKTPEIFEDKDMVVIRYAGPKGAPGMPEMLDPTSRITALCRQKSITIALMTDARFSGGSVGLVVGHVGPEAFLGGPIALVKDGDSIIVDVEKDTIDCAELRDPKTFESREANWIQESDENGGIHPLAAEAETRLLKRMRKLAVRALEGAGMRT